MDSKDKVFTQNRFSNAAKNDLLRFVPTANITGQIFNIIKDYDGTMMVYGEKGISKSFSFALRVMLSWHCSRYWIEAIKANK